MSADTPVALITGGAHGIGAGIAAHLAAKGWRVVTADMKPAPANAPGRHTIADVADEAAVAALLQGVAETEGRLDGLVCNAGIMIRKPVEQLSLGEWRRVLDTNLTSSFLLTKAAAPLLRASGRGAIVTIASTRAHMSEPDTESYSASKGGLMALTHALAVSLGPDIRVNCISPGWINVSDEALRPEDHAQHPAGRVGQPKDVASLAAWLLGEDAGFVTGAEFITDGGMTRKMIYPE
ncbi:SDR family oxidoreductase [Roseomonas aerophila]|uniref:SDR family oxidoreductase n=1 Tax=Teichococcus aerophilus TaxID=1224513 RepID=A0ABR7RPU2_9PROT|nr:SDR family oxidoreductase [Pseudoroseomonas aerophila]MBC9208611.1 SDR family oxidoreductase [Pseudoroseomonas aerophila]